MGSGTRAWPQSRRRSRALRLIKAREKRTRKFAFLCWQFAQHHLSPVCPYQHCTSVASLSFPRFRPLSWSPYLSRMGTVVVKSHRESGAWQCTVYTSVFKHQCEISQCCNNPESLQINITAATTRRVTRSDPVTTLTPLCDWSCTWQGGHQVNYFFRFSKLDDVFITLELETSRTPAIFHDQSLPQPDPAVLWLTRCS